MIAIGGNAGLTGLGVTALKYTAYSSAIVGVRAARDTAAHSEFLSSGVQIRRALGSTSNPEKLLYSTFVPMVVRSWDGMRLMSS